MALQLNFSVSDKITTISFKGQLNEANSTLDSLKLNPNFDLNLDLKELRSINSLGIKNFHTWAKQITCQRLRIYYCPRIFVHQLNMVSGFMPEKTEVESFFVPYINEDTGEEKDILFTKHLEFRMKNGKLELTRPAVVDSQGNKMEMDVIEDRYFRFLDLYS